MSAKSLNKDTAISLAGGGQLPIVGLGLWQNKDPREVSEAVGAAVQAGYRHFDTAQIYGNEDLLAQALTTHGVMRKDIFITTKISVFNLPSFRIEKSFDTSLKKLNTDYVDLVLIHFPVTAVRQGAWKHLKEWHEQGRARAIGVSNYTIRHLQELQEQSGIAPAVNQVELHVFLQQSELLAYCREKGIVVEAYSPLAHGHGMDNAVLVEMAAKYGKTPAHIMLRWCLQVGTVPLPKSVKPSRIRENIDLFDFVLSDEDMKVLATLNQNKRTCWDPTRIP